MPDYIVDKECVNIKFNELLKKANLPNLPIIPHRICITFSERTNRYRLKFTHKRKVLNYPCSYSRKDALYLVIPVCNKINNEIERRNCATSD